MTSLFSPISPTNTSTPPKAVKLPCSDHGTRRVGMAPKKDKWRMNSTKIFGVLGSHGAGHKMILACVGSEFQMRMRATSYSEKFGPAPPVSPSRGWWGLGDTPPSDTWRTLTNGPSHQTLRKLGAHHRKSLWEIPMGIPYRDHLKGIPIGIFLYGSPIGIL